MDLSEFHPTVWEKSPEVPTTVKYISLQEAKTAGWRTENVKTQHEPAAEAESECYIFTRAVSESPVRPHVSNHIFHYKCIRTRVGSPFTDIENAPPQLNFTRQLSTQRY